MKAVTFGEIMMRLNPEGYLRFVQANSFEVSYAGGEANVAVSLANYGVDAAFVSKVPAHEIGQCVVNELRRYGVDTKYLLRGSLSASDNDWAGMLYDAASDKAVFSPTYRIHIVDRVGGGDSFGGGLIYALMSGKDDQAAINFAVAASCLKHSIEHDFNQMSVAEVEALAAGNASGRVQR